MKMPPTLAVLVRLEAVLDGAEGYVSETGDGSRYWREGVLEDARRLIDEWRKP